MTEVAMTSQKKREGQRTRVVCGEDKVDEDECDAEVKDQSWVCE